MQRRLGVCEACERHTRLDRVAIAKTIFKQKDRPRAVFSVT
jgi:hypothetical protein